MSFPSKKLLAAGMLTFSLAAPALAASAVPFFGRELRPLMSLMSIVSLDYGETWTRRQAYIFTDGTVLVSGFAESFEQSLPDAGFVVSGPTDQRALKDLRVTLRAASLEDQVDCFLDPGDAPVDRKYVVTWYGPGTSEHSFRILDGGPGLPDCPPAVEAVRETAERVILRAARSRTTGLSTP